MKSTMKAVMVTVAVVAVGLVSGCGGSGVTGPASGSASSSPSAGATPDGAALYAANCAGCHRALASSTKKGITLARLQNAIAGNVGNMGFLSTLSSVEQLAIVTALAPASTTPPPTPAPTTDGAALYAANCAGCHGVLASSGKKGITLTRLQNAITGNVGNMGVLSSLTSAQQQAIVTALNPASTPAPVPAPAPVFDALTYYNSTCLGCHGSLGVRTAAQIQAAINSNLGGMRSLVLTSAQVAAIAAVSN